MQQAQKIASMVLSLRKKEMIKVRQPLQRIMIPVLNDEEREEILAVADLIKSEVNVKEIEMIDDASGIVVKTIKPNFKVLGPRFGKDMKIISEAIQNLTQDDIATVEKQQEISLVINEKVVNLKLEEVEITSQDIEGWLVANQGGLTVALDITITEDLRMEGNARELVNRVQNLRKDSGLEVTDKITLVIQKNDILERSIIANEHYIKTETLTKELVFVDELENGTEIAFDDVQTKILIEKN
jgi:isoleucyl-tRNA synthetase